MVVIFFSINLIYSCEKMNKKSSSYMMKKIIYIYKIIKKIKKILFEDSRIFMYFHVLNSNLFITIDLENEWIIDRSITKIFQR